MPQLDPSSFASQLFWLTVCFIVLYVLLARKLLPTVQSVLAQRAGTIAEDLGEAKRMKAEAELAREHYEKALVQARVRSQTLMQETREGIAARASARQAALDAEIAKKLAQSEAEIASATKAVLGKLAGAAAELTAAITEAVMQQKPESARAESAVSAVIKERG